MTLEETKKVYVFDLNPYFHFDVVENVASNLPYEAAVLLKRINYTFFAESILANPSLLNRYC